MTTTKIALFAGAAVVVAGGLVLAIRMNPSTSTNDGHGTIAAPVAAVQQTGQLDQLNPFTHVASIPAIVDPSTIRFEKLRTVELASKTKTTTDAQDCKDRQFRDPDGTNCQSYHRRRTRQSPRGNVFLQRARAFRRRKHSRPRYFLCVFPPGRSGCRWASREAEARSSRILLPSEHLPCNGRAKGHRQTAFSLL